MCKGAVGAPQNGGRGGQMAVVWKRGCRHRTSEKRAVLQSCTA